ncbi:MAG: hypothetical protein AAGG01_03740 [Planctomycetota bacterium]
MISHFSQSAIGRLFLALPLVLTAVFLSGCPSAATTRESIAAATIFEGERTYAWKAEAPMEGRVGDPAGQEDVASRFRSSLDDGLEKAGFKKVSANEARFHASLYLGIEKDTRESDPLFTVYPFERIERGHSALSLTLVETDEVVWIAQTSKVLRVTERGMGQAELRWTGTEETRDWDEEQLAKRLSAKLPR